MEKNWILKQSTKNYISVWMVTHEEAGEVIDQWKQSTNTDFDMLACEKLVATDMGLAYMSTLLWRESDIKKIGFCPFLKILKLDPLLC